MDPYLLLEVPYAASIDDIKKAYRELAKKWHPDTNDGSRDAEEKFKSIQAAYDCLIDPIKRAAVDLERKRRQEQAQAAMKAEAERQARARAQAPPAPPPPQSNSTVNLWAVGLAVLGAVALIDALSDGSKGRKRKRS